MGYLTIGLCCLRSLGAVTQFLVYKSFTFLVKFIPVLLFLMLLFMGYFFFRCFIISVKVYHWFLHAEFFYPENLLISSNTFLVDSLGFSIYKPYQQIQTIYFFLSNLNIFCFSVLPKWARTSYRILSSRVGILFLFLILQEKLQVFVCFDIEYNVFSGFVAYGLY